jgi:midasin
MEQLQIYRAGNNLFAGKESTVTVRDLLKWATRLRHADSISVDELAIEGYLVLGERSRVESEKKFIKETIEKVANVKICEKSYYQSYYNKHI